MGVSEFVFITAGFVGFLVTLLAWTSRPYRLLSQHYQEKISNTV